MANDKVKANRISAGPFRGWEFEVPQELVYDMGKSIFIHDTIWTEFRDKVLEIDKKYGH